MTRKKPETLTDAELEGARGGTGTLKNVEESNTEASAQKTIIGGFKSLSGMDSETEVVEAQAHELSHTLQQKAENKSGK